MAKPSNRETKSLMLEASDVERRANTAFERNWRTWAQARFAGGGASDSEPRLAVSLRPPREADLRTGAQIAQARAWATRWRDCELPGIEWETRSWASVGTQSLPVRVALDGPEQIALWAGRSQLWERTCARMADIRERFCSKAGNVLPAVPVSEASSIERLAMGNPPVEADPSASACAAANSSAGAASSSGAGAAASVGSGSTCSAGATASPSELNEQIAHAIRTSIASWCALGDDDWAIALHVWSWLFNHPGERCYVRQLPIRGVDTKWIEAHGKALQDLHRAFAGSDFAFAKPAKQFRCKACCEQTRLGGCDEFSLSASGLSALKERPRLLVICENLVNTLCLHDLSGTLAIHGSGFAIAELKAVPWLAETPILYWGDIDSNGFSILNLLRTFAPHALSVMMDERTLRRHFDLCVDEPKPATGTFEHLTPAERSTLAALSEGDCARGITNLRLEQERIEWSWAYRQMHEACTDV